MVKKIDNRRSVPRQPYQASNAVGLTDLKNVLIEISNLARNTLILAFLLCLGIYKVTAYTPSYVSVGAWGQQLDMHIYTYLTTHLSY